MGIMKHLNFKFVKIHPKAIAPEKIAGNIAFDLNVVRDEEFFKRRYPGESDDYRYILKPGQRRLFHTGLKMAIPAGYGVVHRDRSGMAAKCGIHVLAGVIDSTYRGEWLVCLLNTSDKPYEIIEKDRIVQAVVVEEYNMTFVEDKGLDDTARGEGGFGSSGR